VRLLVFDLDGTLVNSRADLARSANAVLAEAGCDPLDEEAIGRMVGDGAATLVARAFEAAKRPQPFDALARFLAIYNARLLDRTRAYEGIPETLASLGRRARLGVLTNKPLAPTREILKGLDLARFFAPDLVLGGDGPQPRKPDPAGLLELARRAGVDAPRVMLVGDSLVDWQTARSAGAQICVVRYGFGFSGFPDEALDEVDAIVDRPDQLATLL
jgi:phosphoglycolate phosphatase